MYQLLGQSIESLAAAETFPGGSAGDRILTFRGWIAADRLLRKVAYVNICKIDVLEVCVFERRVAEHGISKDSIGQIRTIECDAVGNSVGEVGIPEAGIRRVGLRQLSIDKTGT